MQSSPVNYRNLEQIQEGSRAATSRLTTLILGVVGGASLVVVGVAVSDRSEGTTSTTVDPLSVLVAQAEEGTPQQLELNSGQLSFPEVLSDSPERTTALVAVKDERGRIKRPTKEGEVEIAYPDNLERPPQPAGALLNATEVTKEPKDGLTRLASDAASFSSDAPLAESGSPGAFVIQVASFREQADADRFVHELRQRNHRAYREAANVPDRGLWHRV
ncbi:MAG: SPOR domain-containing protein, partial [Polyangiaceae bacterium]|nr:SPOR domain-containing protein [Polyangiaceae bacterium]